ncbi:MAG: sigma-54-dependent Fis family transcriptional regulator [Planctomycetes bacterium]|nr:sigma-54-dependent Fis family transcriptional regulator [Planctomycetota bacterium]
MKTGVLIVDDEAYVRESLQELLLAEGLRVATASGANEALEILAKQRFDVIVTDLRMPSGDGLSLLQESRAAGIAIPILVISGAGTVADAVAAMKAGAFDFLQKPVDPDELVLLVRRAAERRELDAEVASLRRAVARLEPPQRVVARSPAMARVLQRIEQVAAADTTVLIRGEVGSGKELAATEVHRRSPRARGPFVVVDAGSLGEEAFETGFLGAQGERAGRLAEAEGGTILLDDVGALPPAVQARFARLLESNAYEQRGAARMRHVDVRWMAATADDLERRVREGTFRADLLLRLDVFRIDVPPLRERQEDLPELAAMLLAAARSRISGKSEPAQPLGAEAVEALASHGWPGNVRELGNALERAAIVGEGRPVGAELLLEVLELTLAPRRALAGAEFNLRRNLDQLERRLVLQAIGRTRGRKREACDLLGIDARNLGYYVRKHRIREDEIRQAAEG